MDLFVSTYENKIDAKGRVSVPAAFRSVLAKEGMDGVYCFPSPSAPALEAGGERFMSKMHMLFEDLPEYDEARDDLAMAIYGSSENLKIDGDGRITLPPGLREHAGIGGRVVFVGMGDKFRIWEPERFQAQMSVARKKAREHRNVLGAGKRRSSGAEGTRE